MRRLARWVLRTVLVLLVLAVLLVGGALVAVRTTRGEAALRAAVVDVLAQATGARVSIGALGGSFVRSVEARDVAFRFAGGTELRVARVHALLSPLSLLRGLVLVDDVALDGVRVRAVRTDAGWGLPEPPADQDDTPSRQPRIVVDAIRVSDGRVAVALLDAAPPRRVAAVALTAEAGLTLDTGGLTLRLDDVSLTPRGIDVSPVSARGVVRLPDGGGVVLDDVVVATRRSRLGVAGAFVPGERVDVAVAPLALSAREVRALLPGVALATDVAGTASARGAWSDVAIGAALTLGAGGRVATNGRLDLAAAPIAWNAEASVADVDPRAVLATLPDGHVSATATAHGGSSGIAGTVRLAPSTIAGQTLARAVVAGRLDGERVRARGRVAHAGGVASIQAAADIAGPIRYRVRTRATISDLAALVPETPGTGSVRARVSGVEPADGPRTARLDATIDRAVVRGVVLDGGDIAARLDGPRLRLDRARIRGAGADATAWALADLDTRRADAGLDARAALDVVGRQAALPIAGTATMRATASGTLDALAVDAWASVTQARWETTDIQRAELVAHGAGLGSPTPSGRATLTASAVHVPGRDPWDLAAETGWRRADGTDDLTVRASGRASGGSGVRLDLTARRPTTGATVVQLTELVLAPAEQPSWRLTTPARITLADGITVDGFTLAAGRQRLTVAGHAGTTGPANATLRATAVDVAGLCTLAAPTLRCGGTLTADARLTGTASAPLLSATAAVDSLRVDDAAYGPLTVRAQYATRALTLQARLAYPQAGDLDLEGSFPIDLAWTGTRQDLSAAPIAIALRTTRLDLGFLRALAPGSIRRSEGELTADLRLRGSWDALQADGAASLTASRLELAATGVPYEDVRLRVRAAESSLIVEELHARAGDGTLTGSGRIGLSGLRPGEADVRIRLLRFLAVRLPAYEAAVDGELTIGGGVTAPDVRGRIDVTRAVVRPSVLPSSNPSRQPDPTIEVVGLPPAPEEPEPTGPGVAEALALGIEVHIRDNTWIRRDDANIELAGDLRITKVAGGPVLVSGSIRLVRGWYAFQGRRFELEEGLITFTGSDPPDPSFAIRASHRAGQYRVLIEIGGSAAAPTLTLSSEPPLDQADVLAILLFGRPSSDLGRGESVDLQKQAVSLAAGYVMPELRTSVMEALSLDSFEVGDEGVRAGRYVTRDVFVSLSQEFGPQKGQGMAVEYGVTPSISLKLSTSTRGDSAVDLLWHRRY